MKVRRMLALGVATAAAVAAVVVGYELSSRPRSACGCSIYPELRRPAANAAARFETGWRIGTATAVLS